VVKATYLGSKSDTNPGPPVWGLCVRPAPSPWKTFLLKNLNRGKAASRKAIIGNYVLRRPKHSTIEVVAPKEE